MGLFKYTDTKFKIVTTVKTPSNNFRQKSFCPINLLFESSCKPITPKRLMNAGVPKQIMNLIRSIMDDDEVSAKTDCPKNDAVKANRKGGRRSRKEK